MFYAWVPYRISFFDPSLYLACLRQAGRMKRSGMRELKKHMQKNNLTLSSRCFSHELVLTSIN